MESFKKRQKEAKRLERQRDKTARRFERKHVRLDETVDAPPEDDQQSPADGLAAPESDAAL
jgi:hypothetical protein